MRRLSESLKIRYESIEDLPIAPLLRSGVSILFETPWHLHGRPSIDRAKCTKCWLCWAYCPEGVVRRGEGGPEVDYARCKGCGICANECPTKAIAMEVP
ncbi:MAG: 4Fe-4S binding protein [Candidatus Nezhaarchaeales archaeon]